MMSADSQPENVETSSSNTSNQEVKNKTDEQITPETSSTASSGQATEPAPAESAPVESAVENSAKETEAPTESLPETSAPAVETTDQSTENQTTETPATTDIPETKKVQLKPTIQAGLEKAVPSLEPGAGIVAEEGSIKIIPDVSNSGPVAIPKGEDLDSEMEAEIEAALAGGELDTPGAATPETESEDSSETEKAESEEELEAGQRLTGKIQSVNNEDVFLDVGFRSSALVSRRQFTSGKDPLVGQQIEIVFDKFSAEDGLIHANLPHGLRKSVANWDAVQKGQIVDCMVMSTNKGGLNVNVGNLKAFLPASQVELGYASDLEPYVGQKLRVKVTDVNAKKRNLVVSRRGFLQIERKEKEKELWTTLAKGQKLKGTVKTLVAYGAFVDIGGADGFIHIGELSWSRIKHPSTVLKEGQEIDVVINSLDQEKKKIGLGYRELTQDPWLKATETYETGATVSGRVTRTAEFGAFVELEPGVEGLIHISELDYQRVKRVADVLKPDQNVEAQVLSVDLSKRRISLSLKALKEKPETEKSDEELSPSGGEKYVRKRKGPLKGGTGSPGSGGLFGSSSNFS